MSLTAARHATPMMEIYLRRWADLYRRRFYQLALFEIRSGIDRLGENSILRFLEAQTLLNLHRPEIARGIIDSLEINEAEFKGIEEPAVRSLGENLREALEEFDAAYKKNPKLAGPGEPFAWLEDPHLIGQTGNLVAAVSGGALAGSHIPGSLIEKIDIFPDRGKVLLEVRQQIEEDVEVLAQEALDALSETENYVTAEEEKESSHGGTETIRKEKPRLGPPKITANTPKAPEAMPPPLPPPPVKETLEVAWEEWQQTFRELVREGKIHQALAHVEKARDRFPDHPDLTEFKARMLEELGSEQEAADSLATAATTAFRRGRTQDADRLVNNLISLKKIPPRSLIPIAAMLAAGGLGVHAAQVLQAAIPKLSEENDVEGVREALQHLVRLRPGDKALQTQLYSVNRQISNLGKKAVTGSLPPPVRQVANRVGPRVSPPNKKGDAVRQGRTPPPPPQARQQAGNHQTGSGKLLSMEDASGNELSPREHLASITPLALLTFVVGGIFVLGGYALFAALCGFFLQRIRSQVEGKPGIDLEVHVMKIGVIILYVGAVLAFFARRAIF
ncbi:MAG: hypothetical protein JJU11_17400 [Candidatus Sumerlaeia bacterium]|nr:hypothetical protein [Candidatus Sumerlaeia bacterium]